MSLYKTGKLIVDLITEANVTQTSLSRSTGVSPVFTNHITRGRRIPPPEWLDLVSQTMNLPEEKRKLLHATAAMDLASKYGYDVGLSKTDENS